MAVEALRLAMRDTVITDLRLYIKPDLYIEKVKQKSRTGYSGLSNRRTHAKAEIQANIRARMH